MPRIGVVLSGCGVNDGSEIQEAVSGMLALAQAGAQYFCMAPDIEFEVVNHLTGDETGEQRNVLVESARIARGKITPLSEVSAGDYDGFFFPGGFGAAKNLSNFASEGAAATVNDDVARLVREAHRQRVPLCFVCISPVLPAAVLGKNAHPQLTIGTDAQTADAIGKLGGRHIECPVREAIVDRDNLIVSSPAYMDGKDIAEVFEGIQAAVGELLKLVAERQATAAG